MRALSVIILSQNATNLLACVAAVRRYEPDLQIIVVDDGLDREKISVDWIESVAPLALIPGSKPFVYACNCNLGIRAARGEDIILLNDDAVLESPAGFRALQAQHYMHPEYGLIGSSIDLCGTPNQHRQPGDGLREENVMLVFACVFIPSSTVEKIGLLDERFAIGADGIGPRGYGCEDDDYSWRARQAGLKLGVYDGCFVNHTTLVSTFRGDPQRRANVFIHEALFEQKWGHHPRKPCQF